VPGNRTTRYNRTWIVGQTDLENRVLSGRIGFQGSGTTEWFDEASNDFIDISIPAGTTAPFAINLETLEAVMQAGSGQIKIRGLIGAFEALLADAGFKWRIVGFSKTVSLAEWKTSVEKVISIRFTIKKPNPHYGARDSLKALMEELETEAIKLEAFNEHEGVNLDSEFVLQTEEHIELGYGDAEYRGIKRDGGDVHESVYSTSYGVEEDSEEVPVDPGTGEVPTATLRTMISAEQEAAAPESYRPQRRRPARPDISKVSTEGENGFGDYLTDPFSDD
jgi:hypothetical protein